jgi:hypothetical protein
VNEKSTTLAYAIAFVAGTILWFATSAVSGRREPWDASLYWTVAYPIAIALSGILGYVFPQQPWRWAAVVIFSQVIAMIVGGSGFGLLPLGMVLLTVLALPAVGLASLGAWLRRRGGDG